MRLAKWLLLGLLCLACSDDDDDRGSQAQRLGIGAACDSAENCDQDLGLECLAFKGGYCGLEGCSANIDCPAGSACVAHDDGNSYCFLICTDKPQCNRTRPLDAEANCSANVTFVDDGVTVKACVPPS